MPVLSLACHLPHNTPNIPSRYNNEQTTKQTKAINNSYIYIYISHVNVTQTVPDISPLMPMHQDPLLVQDDVQLGDWDYTIVKMKAVYFLSWWILCKSPEGAIRRGRQLATSLFPYITTITQLIEFDDSINIKACMRMCISLWVLYSLLSSGSRSDSLFPKKSMWHNNRSLYITHSKCTKP